MGYKTIMKILLLLLVGGLWANQDIFLGEEMDTGFVDIERGKLFYWFFMPRNKKVDAPILLWLTGGPGTSTTLALFSENGPFFVNDDLSLRKNVYSWNSDAYMIFLEQPVGTGLSTSKTHVVNEEQVVHDIYLFLLELYKRHPKIVNNDFFISGESYAGHYLPSLGRYILQQKDTKIRFKGIAVGNGLVSAYYQYPAYSTYAYAMKNISYPLYALTSVGFAMCQAFLKAKLWQLAMFECQLVYMFIIGPPFYQFFNQYDVRLPCPNPPGCYDSSSTDRFMEREDVRKIIHAEGYKYSGENYIVFAFMYIDWWFDVTADVAYILERGVPILSYNGDMDFLFNWRGGLAWADDLEWSGKEEFRHAEFKDWNFNGAVAATYKIAKGFSFAIIKDSGHMVPMDKPEFSLEMINRFMLKGIS